MPGQGFGCEFLYIKQLFLGNDGVFGLLSLYLFVYRFLRVLYKFDSMLCVLNLDIFAWGHESR